MRDVDLYAVYGQIFDSTVVAIGITDFEGRYTMVNPAWSNYLGYTLEEAQKLTVYDVTPIEERANNAINLKRLVTRQVKSIRTTRRYLRKDGSLFWADLHVTALFEDDEDSCCLLGLFVNIDPQKKAEQDLETLNNQLTQTNIELQKAMEELRSLASKDPLTQLYNRRILEEVIEHEVKRGNRNKRGLGLALGDIDDFKQINDTYGHECGDKVLIELARVLRQSIRTSDIVGRWGGEEFLFILPETNTQGAMIVMERIRNAVAKIRIDCCGEEISFTMSLGMSYQTKNPTRESLVDEADKALYKAKRDGKNRSYCFQDIDL